MRSRTFCGCATGSMPSTRIDPEVGLVKPSHISMVVVLPAPLGPKSASSSPRRAVKESPSTAVFSPKRLTTLSTTSA